MRKSWPTRGCCAMGKKLHICLLTCSGISLILQHISANTITILREITDPNKHLMAKHININCTWQVTHCTSGKIQLSIFDMKQLLKPGTNSTIYVLVSTEVSLHPVYNTKLWDLITPICIT